MPLKKINFGGLRSTTNSITRTGGEFGCRFISYWLDESLKIFMQVFFVVTFLSLFFFLYVVKIEREIFIDQINFVVDDLYDSFATDMNETLPPAEQTYLKNQLYDYVNQVQIPPEDDQSIQDQNNEVLDQTKQIVITIGTILFSIVISLVILRFCTDLPHQLVENIIVLFFMGMSEFAFLNLVTKKYIASNPNHVKLYFLQEVVNYANQKTN